MLRPVRGAPHREALIPAIVRCHLQQRWVVNEFATELEAFIRSHSREFHTARREAAVHAQCAPECGLLQRSPASPPKSTIRCLARSSAFAAAISRFVLVEVVEPGRGLWNR